MINFNKITKALETILNSNIEVSEFMNKKLVVVGEVINYDPNETPWIGIYRGEVDYEPRTLGSMNNWEAFPSIRVVVQAADFESAYKCEEDLEGYVKKIIEAVLQDTTIGGTVDIVTKFKVEQGYIETDLPSTHFQGASITFNMEVATQ